MRSYAGAWCPLQEHRFSLGDPELSTWLPSHRNLLKLPRQSAHARIWRLYATKLQGEMHQPIRSQQVADWQLL